MVEPQEEQPQFTPEEEKLATEIQGKEDFYDILGVEKSANDDQIKKAYRKLALKVHPDKNRAPSAQDAFKKVGTAYACLSDASKRKHYDMFGKEMGDNGGGPQFHDINPDEIFKQFFGPGGIEDILQQFMGAAMAGQGGRGRGRGAGNPLEQMMFQAMSGGMQGGRGRGGAGGGPRMQQMGPGVFSMSFGGPMGGGMQFGGAGGSPFSQFQTGPQLRRRQQNPQQSEQQTRQEAQVQEQEEEEEKKDASEFANAFFQGFQNGHKDGQQQQETDIESEMKMLCCKCCGGCFVLWFLLCFLAPYIIGAAIRMVFGLLGFNL